jgi:hypothetical protein
MSQYTAGPWRIEHHTYTNRTAIARVGPFSFPAIVTGNSISDQEVDGNAHLIASAPELLEALKGALLSVEWRVAVMHGPGGINPDPEASRALSQFAMKCRTAIAKAEGRS